ncbi:hypothetical protein C8R45DRAFT_1076267 [Mycena sanguinolenta]|nr:hypothetical protein C8R45DRAFT_1076267 [Mycena sanguinolenta]
MAHMIFMLVAFIGAPQCNSFSLQASTGVDGARNALAAVNVAIDPNARNLLEAQFSLLDAHAGENELAAGLSDGRGGASTGAKALISALQSVAESDRLFIANSTFAAVATANASALENAQQAVAANC